MHPREVFMFSPLKREPLKNILLCFLKSKGTLETFFYISNPSLVFLPVAQMHLHSLHIGPFFKLKLKQIIKARVAAYIRQISVYISLFLLLSFLCRIRSVSNQIWKDMIKCPLLWVRRAMTLLWPVFAPMCVREQVICIPVNHPLKNESLKRSQGFC